MSSRNGWQPVLLSVVCALVPFGGELSAQGGRDAGWLEEEPCRLRLDPLPGYLVQPGETVRVTVDTEVDLSLGHPDSRRPSPPSDAADSWGLGAARLGTAEPESGKLRWEARERDVVDPKGQEYVAYEYLAALEFDYRAGEREGVEQIPVRLWNSELGPWGEGAEHPGCVVAESMVPIYIGADWTLLMGTRYQGTGSRGEATWNGIFTVEGDSVRGAGVYHQIDRGSCFRSEASQDFRITGVREDTPDGPVVTLQFPYVGEKRGGDPHMNPSPECALKGLAEAGTLLFSVAGRMKGGLEEVRMPLRHGARKAFNDVVVELTNPGGSRR